jgi:hypothetical protein
MLVRARWSAVLLLALTSCGAAPPQGLTKRPPRPAPVAPAKAPSGPTTSSLPAHIIANQGQEEAPVAFARRPGEALLVLLAKGRFLSRHLAADGSPKADLVDLGPAPEGPLAIALRPVQKGYLLLWVEAVERTTVIKARNLTASGAAEGEVVTIAQSTEDVSFVDALPSANGALVIWEVASTDRYDVLAVPLASGRVTRTPVVIGKGTLGWEAVGTKNGAVFALVRPETKAAPGVPADGTALGRVDIVPVDAAGVLGAVTSLSASPTAHGDVTVADTGAGLFVGWTDERDLDPAAFVGSVDATGKVLLTPRRVTPPLGEQAFVTLVGGAGKALLVWEDVLRSAGTDRTLSLATLSPNGTLGPNTATLTFSASGPPDIVADGDGFAALTLAPVVPLEGSAAQPAPVWPAYVRFAKDLSVRANDVVRAADFGATAGVPYFTQGLSCEGGTCTAVTSGPTDAGPSVAIVELPDHKGRFEPAAYFAAPSGPPRARAIHSVYGGEPLSRIAAQELPGGSAELAWITYVASSADGPSEGPASRIAVRRVGPDGLPAPELLVSQKVHATGGVALAQGHSAKGPRTVMAWVAKDKAGPQVFATSLDEKGAKVAQKAVTVVSRKGKGGVLNEATDVAIAALPTESDKAPTDFAVAWSDTRDGNGEIYVAKLDSDLKKTVPDHRVTKAEGDSVEVQLLVRGKELWLVWSDAREAASEGTGEIYFVRLDARTLSELGPPAKLFSSAGHSRSPVLRASGKGAVVGWIEEADGDETAGAGVRLVVLDETGGVSSVPVLLRPESSAAVTSLTLACDATCRGALSYALGDGLVLGGFAWSPGQPPGPVVPLTGLSGGPAQDVSPSFFSGQGTTLYLADDASSGEGRIRALSLDW